MSFLQNLWLCFHPLLCQPHCYLIFELIRSHNGGKTVRILIPKAKKEDFFYHLFKAELKLKKKGQMVPLAFPFLLRLILFLCTVMGLLGSASGPLNTSDNSCPAKFCSQIKDFNFLRSFKLDMFF